VLYQRAHTRVLVHEYVNTSENQSKNIYTNILCTPAEEKDGTRKMPRSRTDARCPQTVPFKLTMPP